MRIISATGKFIYNRLLGICTKSQINQTVSKVGQKFAQTVKAGGDLNTEVASSIFASCMPKGVRPPRVTSSGKEAGDFIFKNFGHKISAEELSNMTGAATIVGNTQPAILFIPQNKYIQQPVTFINAATHEFSHYLDYEKASIFPTIKRFFRKLFNTKLVVNPKERALYQSTQLACAINSETVLLNPNAFINNLSAIKSVMDKKGVINYFRRYMRVVLSNSPLKERIKLLHGLKEQITSEIAAYRAGGQASKSVLTDNPSLITTSELVSEFQGKFLEAINKELSMLKNSRYRRCAEKLPITSNDYIPIITPPYVMTNLQETIAQNIVK